MAGLKSYDLDYELLMLFSKRTPPAAERLLGSRFRHLNCEMDGYAHGISFFPFKFSYKYNSK